MRTYRQHAGSLFGRTRRAGLGAADARCEALEPRVLLVFNPTAEEQMMLELLNRFRADPVNELARWVDGFGSPAHSPYSNINSALQFFGTKGSTLQEQFADLVAVAPLAWNEDLYEAAEFHSNQQILYDIQSHQIITQTYTEPDLGQRVLNAGYTSATALAENVFAYTEDPIHGHAGFAIDWGDNNDGAIDGIQSPPGHRNTMMNGLYREVGIRYLAVPASGSRETGPFVVTQDFGRRSSQTVPYLLGVVFNDFDQDDFYSVGEGLGSVDVSIEGTGGSFSTSTMLAGGWQIAVPAGTYNVTFSGGSYGGPVTFTGVVVGSQNVKLDAPKGVLPPAPIAEVRGNGMIIADGDITPTSADFTGFGGVNTLNQSLTRTFTIFNAGNATLNLAASLPRIAISGAGAANFTLTMDAAVASLAPGTGTTFKIRFDPSAVGTFNALVSITTDDVNVGTYTFTIQGKGIQRGVAAVSGRSNPIDNGQTSPQQANGTTFGVTPSPGGSSVRVFTISNNGAGTLNLIGTNPITITGPGAAFYRVSVGPGTTTIPQGGSTTFRIRFEPTVLAPQNATITIATSDAVNANYSFSVRGSGTPVAQATVVNGAGDPIPNGDTTPSGAEKTDFGSVAVGGMVTRWFSIKNTGFADLDLNGPVCVTIGGGDAGQFRLPAQAGILPATLAPGAKVSFFVRFKPNSSGTFSTTVTVSTTDPFRPMYTFLIRGTTV